MQYAQGKQSLLTIGNLIKNGCNRCGITQQQLAVAVRLTESTLNSIVSGTAKTTEHAGRILGYLLRTYRAANNVSVETLSAKVGFVPSAITELERGNSLEVSRFRLCFQAIDAVSLFITQADSPKDVQKASHEKQAPSRKKQNRNEKARMAEMKRIQHENDEYGTLMRRAMIFAKRGNVDWKNSRNMPYMFRACRERIKKSMEEVSEAIGYPVKAIEDVEIGGSVNFEMLEALLKYIGTLSVYIANITKTSREVTRIKSNIAKKEKEEKAKVSWGDTTPIRRYKGMDSQITRKEWGAAARPAVIGR